MQPRLDSKRNRRRRWLERNETDSGGDASPQIIEIITKRCLLFIRGARQMIFAQQNVFTRRKRKRSQHRQLEQIPRMSGKSDDDRSSTAKQPNSSGRVRGHPTPGGGAKFVFVKGSHRPRPLSHLCRSLIDKITPTTRSRQY